jgi:hypothetical protein
MSNLTSRMRGNINDKLHTGNSGTRNYKTIKNAVKAIENYQDRLREYAIACKMPNRQRQHWTAADVRYLIVEKDGRYFPVILATGNVDNIKTFQYWMASGFYLAA